MSTSGAHWVRGRGLERILAVETNISDLLQFFSDCDSGPWMDFVGFTPTKVTREARNASFADLLLEGDGRKAVIEVKLGHLMSKEQQENYEKLPASTGLYLAALREDSVRLPAASPRWNFITLSELLEAWQGSTDTLVRELATEASRILTGWDSLISDVFRSQGSDGARALDQLTHKFLARVVTRRIEHDLSGRGLVTSAGVTSGGGLPLVQAWAPVAGNPAGQYFMAEVRWWETKPGMELRLGVDFSATDNVTEDEAFRRAAYSLARSMTSALDHEALLDHFLKKKSPLADLLQRTKPSRPKATGDWEEVIRMGFAALPPVDGKKLTRRQVKPDFYGDGALRFQAITEVSTDRASARDVTDLLEATLEYLVAQQPVKASEEESL